MENKSVNEKLFVLNFVFKNRNLIWLFIFFSMLLTGCDSRENTADDNSQKTMYISSGGKLKTLDPALASEFASQHMVANFYDTLLQYDYAARPYKLIPSMLAKMPEVSKNQLDYKFTLRDDLFFTDDPCFKDGKGRKINSNDVIFSLLRIADARLHSPGFWTIRGKIKGLDKFREKTLKNSPYDFNSYQCEGFEVIDDKTFTIHLKSPYPRLLYVLAMPYACVVPREAIEKYRENFNEHPVGSGPFTMQEWRRNYQITLNRNPKYRQEFFLEASSEEDREKPLPLLDKVVCYLVEQPLSGWLLFLQGELDISTVSKDNFDAVVGDDLKLVPALKKRGIILMRLPEFQINYVGFSFTDPKLKNNLNLRKAVSLAYNTGLRVKHANNNIIPANGPIPPGVPGYDEDFHNPYSQYDIEKAKEFLKEAGYPNGIDPETGQALELSFDLGKSSSQYRQLAELMVHDMKKIGIKIKPVLNNKSRFFQKMRKGKMQLFKISWVGDYPDAENFLQLFYGPNAGSCNRAFYRDTDFDRMYQEIANMPDSPQRTEKYRKMAIYLTGKCPWIFESYPISYRLMHSWLENYLPHDFAFARWKYLSLNPQKRKTAKKAFQPIEMKDLQK
jgi:ABC-type transport system substrate-binding protein